MKNTGILKYAAVKSSIIDNINNKVFMPGHMIPSERELIDLFEVSRITVRKALAELENEGYLYKVQGKGTFVKDERNRQNLFSLTSCTQDIIKLGMTPSRMVLKSEVIPSDEKRRELLNLNENDNLFHLKRVYYADDEPINCTTTYLAYKHVPGIEHFDFSKTSLYEVLESKYDIKITRGTRTVEAVIATDELSDLLMVSPGSPLLLFRCTTFGIINGKEQPFENFKCFYRSDKYSFFINQVR